MNSGDIMKNRRKYEYKLVSEPGVLQRYKEYIDYEKHILMDLKTRRIRKNVNEKKDDIDYKIKIRIKNMYETGSHNFPNDYHFCLSYLHFAIEHKFINAASSVASILMKKHAYVPQVWLICAKLYAYDKGDFPLALQILGKGRALHKTIGYLYNESIMVELISVVGMESAVKKELSDDDREKQELCIKRLMVYLDAAFENVKDYMSFLDLLKELEPYHCTVKVQAKVVDHLEKKFYHLPLIWHRLAQREKKEPVTKKVVADCIAKYEAGLERVPEESKKELWHIYLEYLIDLQVDLVISHNMKTQALLSGLKRAAPYLIEKHYAIWAKVAGEEETEGILDQGLVALPESMELWKLRLQYEILKMNKPTYDKGETERNIEKLFVRAIGTLKRKTLPIWMLILRFTTLFKGVSDCEKFYWRGIEGPMEISQEFKPQFLEWLAITKNIDAARMAYKQLVKDTPYCKQLHLTMSKLEEAQVDINLREWQFVHDCAIEQFGEVDDDVWINYMKFSLNYKDCPNKNEVKTNIRNKAKQYLPFLVYMDFVHKCEQL